MVSIDKQRLAELDTDVELMNFKSAITEFADSAKRAAAELQRREEAVAREELALGIGDMHLRAPDTGESFRVPRRRIKATQPTGGAQEATGVYGAAYRNVFGQFLRKGTKGLSAAAVKTLQEGQEIQGGYLVPPGLLDEVSQRLPSAGVVPYLSQHTTKVSGDEVLIPRIVGSDDGYPSALRFALTGVWTSLPTPSRSDVRTEPLIGGTRAPVITFLASVPVSRDLFQDSSVADLDTAVAQLALETQQATIEYYALNGTGRGQPTGILANVQGSGDTTSTVLSVKSGNASALTADGISNLFGALPAQYITRAHWVMHPTTMTAIMQSKDSSLRPLLTFEGDSAYLYGRPVILSAFMPTVAAGASPIILGELSGAHWVSRTGLVVSQSEELLAESNEVLLRLRFRAAGAVAEPYRFRVQTVSS